MATYWVKSGTGGTDAGTSWSNAAESIAGLMAAQAITGGDTIYVHNTHAHNAGAAITWTLPESGTGLVKVLCVDGGQPTGVGLVNGTVGNLTEGASETTGGNSTFTINCSTDTQALYVHGITIRAGAGGNSASADITINGTGEAEISFRNCIFYIDSTSTGALLTQTCPAGISSSNYNNCTFTFGNASQSFTSTAFYSKLVNCKLSGTAITTYITSLNRGAVSASSCDFANATNVISNSSTSNCKALFSNCVINTPVTGTHSSYSGLIAEFQACASVDGTNGADILSYYYEDAAGNVQDSQTVYKATSGAQGEQDDGTDTSYSLEMNPSTMASVVSPLYTPWIYTLVGSTGDKTITMKVAHTESAVLTTQDIFMEVEYMGEPGATGTQRVANSPHSQMEVDDNCPVQSGTIHRDVLAASASNRTDDAIDDWTGLSSEKEHTLTASINCVEVGYIRCRIGLTKDTTNPVYVDPKINVA